MQCLEAGAVVQLEPSLVYKPCGGSHTVVGAMLHVAFCVHTYLQQTPSLPDPAGHGLCLQPSRWISHP